MSNVALFIDPSSRWLNQKDFLDIDIIIFQTADCVSVYASQRHYHAFPLALLPGHEVRIDNVEKVTSERGYVYFAANCMTRFTSLGPSASEESELSPSNADSAPVSFLRDVRGRRQRRKGSYVFGLTLESVAGLTLSLECGACGSQVGGDGQCGFVGCHATAAILGRSLIKAFG